MKDSQRKIIVVEISNLDFVNKFGGVESSLGAVLQVNFGGMVFGGGPGTKEIGANRFFLPVADNPYQTAGSCIYNFSFTDKHVSFYAVRLDPANPQVNEAIVSVCQVNGIIYD